MMSKIAIECIAHEKDVLFYHPIDNNVYNCSVGQNFLHCRKG